MRDNCYRKQQFFFPWDLGWGFEILNYAKL